MNMLCYSLNLDQFVYLYREREGESTGTTRSPYKPTMTEAENHGRQCLRDIPIGSYHAWLIHVVPRIHVARHRSAPGCSSRYNAGDSNSVQSFVRIGGDDVVGFVFGQMLVGLHV